MIFQLDRMNRILERGARWVLGQPDGSTSVLRDERNASKGGGQCVVIRELSLQPSAPVDERPWARGKENERQQPERVARHEAG